MNATRASPFTSFRKFLRLGAVHIRSVEPLQLMLFRRFDGLFGFSGEKSSEQIRSVSRPEKSFDAVPFRTGFLPLPRLKIVSAENDIGWVPFLMERADKYYVDGNKATPYSYH